MTCWDFNMNEKLTQEDYVAIASVLAMDIELLFMVSQRNDKKVRDMRFGSQLSIAEVVGRGLRD